MEATVPVHVAKNFIKHIYPEIIIDGETAYDVLMLDSLIFYGSLFFIILFIFIYRLIPKNQAQK